MHMTPEFLELEEQFGMGGRTLSFSGLPGTGNVAENSPAGTVVYTFSVDLTPNLVPNISVEVGYPIIINSNPLTKAFEINPASSLLYKVVTTGDLILDYETMPHQFELQILVYDTAGAKDLQILTVQVLDVDEPPVFQGNIATQMYGTVLVAKWLDRDTYPLKEHPNISLILRVVDSPSDGQSDTMEIVITIEDQNDNPPECELYNYRVAISETELPGVIILDLRNSCKDIDAESPNNLFNFTGLSGIGSNKFTQDPPGSGRLKNIYIYVRIEPVNEFAPVFTGSTIGQVNATDPDLPFTGISYSILDLSEVFWIDPAKGRVRTVAKLDYEIVQNYTFTVQASDNEGRTATASVTVNVLEANDEPPICSPNSYLLEVPVDLAFGTNINDFSITCVDRDSSPRSFRYSINSGNVNNHFTFSPSAGSNVSRLMLALPFDYEGSLDRVWDYRLLVLITDDNLLSASNRAAVIIQTGTVTLTIKVIPNPTTTIPTTPGVTIVTRRANVYSASAWYVPFIIALGSLLLLGLLGYLTFLLARYIHSHCPSKPKADKKPLIQMPEKRKAKKEVVWEMTNINPVFDGEAKDPVTGKWYEYNSKSGARKWKDPNVPSKPEMKEPVAQKTITTEPANSGQWNLNKKEADTSSGKLGEQNHVEPKPLEKKTETLKQKSNSKLQKPKEEPTGKGSSSPIITSKSPSPSPKVYPKYEN
ncbi:hypothetical protein JD844_027628 [Phrynosoma platyrhinos]|uniref:Cadherin domain-containing protein n=1 Tax=Phrynosoma platyrhinos TaxID=52577 RepID=A0ABQ7SGQ8_PHRPL|nr:hypothetical protein JD844_027628 [Phrynosoma platyrhinos]